LEVDIMLKISALLAIGAGLCLSAPLQAQSPIPEARVPGFGGADTGPGQPGRGPASSGSDVGSNVGAGATASPVPDPTPSDIGPSVAQSPPPLIGASRPLPLSKPAPKK
jgi:hypothetical protein